MHRISRADGSLVQNKTELRRLLNRDVVVPKGHDFRAKIV